MGKFPTQDNGLDIRMALQTRTHAWEVELPQGGVVSNAQEVEDLLARQCCEPRDLHRPHAKIRRFEHQGIDDFHTPRQYPAEG